MANRSLSSTEIGRLVAISSKRANIIDNRQKWPNREDKRALAQAVKDRRPFVLFGAGVNGLGVNGGSKLFKIRYTKHFGGSVFVSPDGGAFSPCGYFSIQNLEGLLNRPEGLEDYDD